MLDSTLSDYGKQVLANIPFPFRPAAAIFRARVPSIATISAYSIPVPAQSYIRRKRPFVLPDLCPLPAVRSKTRVVHMR